MENQEDSRHHRPSMVLVGSDPQLSDRGGGEDSVQISLPDHENTSTADDEFVEVTLELKEDCVTVQSVNTARGGTVGELVEDLNEKSSLGSLSVMRNASSRIEQASQEPKRLASSDTTRRPARKLNQTQSGLVLEFIGKTGPGATWAGVEEWFDVLASNGLLPRSNFGKCIGMHWYDKEFSSELFDALARRANISGDSITKEQLKEFWYRITNDDFDCRLQIFFDMIDKDADGRITEDEVKEIICLSASANKLSNIQKQADVYAAQIMEELDPGNLGYITVEDLKMFLLQYAEDLERFLLQDPDQRVRGGNESRAQNHPLKRWCNDFQYFLLDNWQRIWVMALWIGVMAGLFAYKYVQYRNRAAFDVIGHCVCVAKGAAETLKLNMALILLPVCRKTVTWLRDKTGLGAAVPFDDNINFHKVIAVAIAIGVGIHGLSHLTCDFPRLLNASPEKYELMEPFFGDQPTSYWHFVKGWEGVTGIVMVVLMAIAFTLASSRFRRNRVNLPRAFRKLIGFNAFWYSHHLFVIVYVLLIIHGIKLYLTHEWYKKTTWMYLAIPIILYAGERLIRAFRSSIKGVKILKVAVYPGNVLALHMAKPPGFNYKSGQYIFVNCAAVSPFEWHPFIITSAPSDDYLSLHIRTLGDWTRQLKAVFSEVCQLPTAGNSGLLRADFLLGQNNPIFPKVLIDGPYGAPMQDYKNYNVVLLVGLGIGVAPMISIVKDIVYNIKAIEEVENALEEGGGPLLSSLTPKRRTSSGSGQHDFKTRRAYFYWITREEGSFDWFKGVMNEIVEMDRNGVIEMHNYLTSVYKEGDVRSALIGMLQSINHVKNGVDIVSGTRAQSHFARPDWRATYKRIALNHPNSTVGVFYCGAPTQVKELKHLACDFSHKTSTKFKFYKEGY